MNNHRQKENIMTGLVKGAIVVGATVVAGKLALKSQRVNNVIGWWLTHPTNKKKEEKADK